MKPLSGHLFLFIIMLIRFETLHAQNESAFNFIGLNPSVTVEPFYEKGELDVNIFPMVYQRPITRNVDIRLTTLCNLGIRKNGNEISHFGLEAALPVFFKPKEVVKEPSKGFFIAPIVSVSRNRMEEHSNLGFWVEPGYNLLFDNNFAMSFGLQTGTTYFNYDVQDDKWGPHFGVKVIFGKWL